MESPEPQVDPDYDSENMQSVVKRMFRAKWITSSLVAPDDVWVALTERGRQQIEPVADAIIRVYPGYFKAENTSPLTAGSIKRSSLVAWLLMSIKMNLIAVKLLPPLFSRGEYVALKVLLAVAAREKGKNQVPPLKKGGNQIPPFRR